MSWLSGWSRRAPMAIDCTTGSSPYDVQCTLPTDWTEFWTYVKAAGADIRVCAADGVTVVANVEVNSFDSTTRTCILKINDVALATAGAHLLWIYWGNSSASTISAAQTLASPKTGYVCVETPRPEYAVVILPQPFGATKSKRVLVKQVTEEVDVYLDFSWILTRKQLAFASSDCDEEINYANVDVQSGGASQGSMLDVTLTRFVQGGARNGIVRMRVKAGSSGTTYSGLITITTTSGRVLQGRFRIAVQNTAE